MKKKEIIEVLEAYENIKPLLNDARAAALELLQNGGKLPGYELKPTGKASKWKKGQTPAKVFTKLKKWIADEAALVALPSPATVKKFIKESPEALVKFKGLIDETEKTPSIAKIK